jgi:signal transduction histidine kinase
MAALNPIIILVNGMTLALALAFLSILLWNDAKKELNQFFAAFLLFVALWNVGSLLWQAFAQIDPESPLINTGIGVVELGFTGSSVAVYSLTAVLVRAHTRAFRILAFASLGLLLVYRIFLFVGMPSAFATQDPSFSFQRQPLVVVFYLIFDFGALVLLWRYRRKVRSVGVTVGLILFIVGQTIGFLNPELRIFSLSIMLSAVAALILSFAIVRQEIIKPLAERNSQVEAIRRVSMAITSLASIDTVLEQIAKQTAELLKTDGGVSIFLLKDGELETATVFQLPKSYIHMRIPIGQGMAGTAALKRQSLQVDDYGRDWKGKEDFPLARATFGSVICTPLIYAGDTIGVLMMVAARHGLLFQREDAYLLELLGAQASLAISHSQLFGYVEAARSQLETVLSSTENPVVAVDRSFSLIFANPAARTLLNLPDDNRHVAIGEHIPQNALPRNLRSILRKLRSDGTYTYEAEFESKVYLCNIACLGRPRINGWVAVMHDVTQLKELDRLKSEMVRMTSHDLKNPLQAAMANVELLRDDLPPDGSADWFVSLDKIDWQLQRMNRIIRGILDLERVKSGAMRLEQCAPTKIIEDSVQEMRHFAYVEQVALKYSVEIELPAIKCDLEQFKRALVNLIENAIKFTPANGQVHVRAYVENGDVVFEVEDNGVGIDMDLQVKIFDRFYRAQQRGTEHITGSGIGLNLVKTIVENHQGRLWLKSRVGVGTTFYVAVPASANQVISHSHL